MKLKKLTALAVSLTMALSMTACGNQSADSGNAEADATTKWEMATTAEETTTTEAFTAETTEATTTEEITTTEPVDKFVTPPAEDFEYTYDAVLKGVKISRYNGGATAVRIPAELDGDPVVQIGDDTEYEVKDNKMGFSNVTQIEIPNSVKIIDENAFLWCENLKSVKIPDSITEIGNSAFEYCTS
ncbi:MAG: leucine-rich repeat domain-containing protein, partial [Ruminococcus sp.]|nr:leucine-rich repeat domain-containing protein [Ruminococcus sp.]